MRRSGLAALCIVGLFCSSSCGRSSIVAEAPEGDPDPVVASVVVSPISLVLATGDVGQVGATVRNMSGAELNGRTIAWSTNEPATATVAGGSGYAATVAAVAEGSATISASVDGITGSIAVTVSDAPVQVVAECDQAAAEWIWCDDFETNRMSSYFEYDAAAGRFQPVAGVGLDGSVGMRARWNQGDDNAGSMHLALGSTPQSYFDPVDDGTANYRELYWRLWVKRQPGWTGGGGYKLSRAFIYASQTSWAQAMIAHVWAGDTPSTANFLLIDPASGTDETGNLITTTYNDFANLRWLGLRQSNTPMFDDARAGVWFCVEAHVRLNQANASDGVFQLWIDDALEAERTDLNWVGNYDQYGLNAVFVENYWNDGAPTAQERYIDNFVVSTARIGC